MAANSIANFKKLMTCLDTTHDLEKYSSEHRLAAVLILVVPGDVELEVILTRRSDHLSTHAGQISFPGGKVDDNDPDPVHTALREASEEIALSPDEVEILGILEVTLLPSGFAVAPVLGVANTLPALVANPDEVEEIFTIPLSLACELSNYQEDYLTHEGERRQFHYLDYEDYYIWGATARMLRTLARALREGAESSGSSGNSESSEG